MDFESLATRVEAEKKQQDEARAADARREDSERALEMQEVVPRNRRAVSSFLAVLQRRGNPGSEAVYRENWLGNSRLRNKCAWHVWTVTSYDGGDYSSETPVYLLSDGRFFLPSPHTYVLKGKGFLIGGFLESFEDDLQEALTVALEQILLGKKVSSIHLRMPATAR